MLVSIRYYFVKKLIKFVFKLSLILFFCEYLIYYIVLLQCQWSILNLNTIDSKIHSVTSEEKPVYAMFLADTHLLGSKNGHWFDKLRREWQMYQAFQTTMVLHKPDIVFILGDIFDEGQWSNSKEFESYVLRFKSMFSVPKNTHLYVLSGNHDIGYHYVITPYLNERFIRAMNAPSVKRVSIRGNHFILINSMALEGDGCFLCRSTEVALFKINQQLKCAKDIGNNCNGSNIIKKYSRPILLQHYPLYRESDEICNEIDDAPMEEKGIKFRERRDCLSREATEQLLDNLNPRLILGGHTHHGCRKLHRQDMLEMTISSFSWRNKNNPAFILGTFTPNNYAISKCYLPIESTIIKIYMLSTISIFLQPLLKLIYKIIYDKLKNFL